MLFCMKGMFFGMNEVMLLDRLLSMIGGRLVLVRVCMMCVLM